MEITPTKKVWQTPQFSFLSHGYVNSGLNVAANEGTLYATGNYQASLPFSIPLSEAPKFGKRIGGGYYKPSTIVS
jgi:hypothetical protein